MTSDKHDKKGFSGLVSLTSNITNIEEPISTKSKTETTLTPNNQAPAPQSKVTPAKVQSTSPVFPEKTGSEKSNDGSGGKWTLGIIGILLVIWFVNHESNKKPSYNSPPQSDVQNRFISEMPTSSTVKNPDLQYTKPSSVGTDNILSIPEIRWCIRESIRIETMKTIIDTNGSIDAFNQNVDDYNSYCGSYRYRPDSQQSAESDVEPYRSQIVAEAVQEAKQLSQPSLPLYPLASPSKSVNNTSSNSILSSSQSPNLPQDSVPQYTPSVENRDGLEGMHPTPLKLNPIEDANVKFKVMVNTEQANIRLSPEKKNNILGVVTQGQQLSVISESGDYFLVKTFEGDGFIHNSVVHRLDESSLSSLQVNNSQSNLKITTRNNESSETKYPVVNSANSNKEKFKVIVTALEANLRKTPQKEDNILGVVKKGERLSVVDITDDYYLVSTSSGDVFIHNSTVQSEPKENNKINNSTNLSDINTTIANLPYEDQSAIGSACVLTRSEGAAAYRRCVKQQVDQLQGTVAVDISHLPYEDQSAIGSACVLTRSEGAAAYRRCVKQQVDQLQGTAAVDISHLPYEDQSAIGSACVLTRSEGAAAYRRCVKQQVDQLNKI